MSRRRRVEVFSLSFLDIICCGFGAVVLFYTVIAGQAGIDRLRLNDELQAEVNRLEEEVLEGMRSLVVLRNTLQRTESDTARSAARTRQLLDEVGAVRVAAINAGATSVAQREHINQLKADLLQMEEDMRRLEAAAVQAAPVGEQVRAFRGTGNRQYITGIELTGKHILVLVDRSASMMHHQLDMIIRLRNQSPALRRNAPKWRQTLDIADWVSTQFPSGSRFQFVGFNTSAAALVDGTDGRWLDPADPQLLASAINTLRGLTPEGGTSLVNAFAAIRSFTPRPDQVVLITDGLPTQGASRGVRNYVNAAQRTRLFDEAARSLPPGVPMDVILLPMEGDLPAPHRFWALARESGGKFMIPAADWP